MKKIISYFISVILTASIVLNNISTYAYANENLWNKFLKYDLCITNYNALTDEEKELCRFIFDTEQAADDTVICERARRTLAGDTNIGERITLNNLVDCYGIWDNYSVYKNGWQNYIHCVPDIIHLDGAYYGYVENEYWLDDKGSTYVMFNEKMDIDDIKSFDVYNKSGDMIETFPALELDSPYKDFRHDAKYREKFGFIEKDGGYYYIKSDGTAVFAWSDYTASDSSEPVEKPFIVEKEINDCPVTAIENGAFSNSALTEIVLPDTIEFIDRLAFSTCRNLKTINFPENLKYIGNLAFMGCNSLNGIELNCPQLKIIKEAFSDCNGLTDVSLNAKEIDEAAFSSCMKLRHVTIGEDVTRLGANAFENCSELETVSFSKGTKVIGQAAFLNTKIKSITLLPTVEIIGALPMKKPVEYTSIGVVESHPLTDTPECAFESDCAIYGYKDTEAESYAKEWNLEFNELEALTGDVNFDNEFNISDIITLQKWLSTASDTQLTYWKAADLCEDGKINVFDFIVMKRMLTETPHI